MHPISTGIFNFFPLQPFITTSCLPPLLHSVISSRDQTPEDVRIGLRRFHESRYPLVETSALQKTEISDTDIEENTRSEILGEVKGGNEQQQHKKANVRVRSVVTAVKAKKPNELSLEKSNSQEDGCEGNLTGEILNYIKEDTMSLEKRN